MRIEPRLEPKLAAYKANALFAMLSLVPVPPFSSVYLSTRWFGNHAPVSLPTSFLRLFCCPLGHGPSPSLLSGPEQNWKQVSPQPLSSKNAE